MEKTEGKMVLARNLTKLLELAQMSQTELAARLKVSKTAVSSWCSGAKVPRMDKVDEMARMFGVSRASFFAESGPDMVVTDARGDQLKKIFYLLNQRGQDKLVDYALDLLNHPDYKG